MTAGIQHGGRMSWYTHSLVAAISVAALLLVRPPEDATDQRGTRTGRTALRIPTVTGSSCR